MNNEIKEKINYFLSKGIEVHVKKKNGKFYNGQFLMNLGDDVYSFMDRMLGKVEVFVSEVEDIVRYKEEGEMGSE